MMLVRKVLIRCYSEAEEGRTPTIEQILEAIEGSPVEGRASGWRQTAQRAIESLSFAQFSTEVGDQQEFARNLLRTNTIIEMDALPENARKFLVTILSQWIYFVQMQTRYREELQMVIVVEEAHHVLHKRTGASKELALETLLRLCRELGIGYVLVDQQPTLASSSALGNCYTTIMMAQKTPADVSMAAGLSMIDSSQKDIFQKLPVGHAVVKMADRWREPFLVRIPLVDLDKGSVDDQNLKNYLNFDFTQGHHVSGNRHLKPFSLKNFTQQNTLLALNRLRSSGNPIV